MSLALLALGCVDRPVGHPDDPKVDQGVGDAPDSGARAETGGADPADSGDSGAPSDSGGTDTAPPEETGAIEQPSGDWVQVTAGWVHTCGLHGDGAVECWGDDTFDQLEVPSGTYVAISAAWEETCGLLDDHTITCWGLPSGGITGQQPEGEWVAISCMYDICGAVTSNGEATWWGRRTFGGAAPPDVGIVDIHAGARGLGVVDEAGDVQVWWESVDGTYGSYAVPSGSAVTASVLDASESGCWLDAGGWPTCWGGADDMFFDMPGGVAFADLSMSSERACAVTSAGELDCWGDCPSSDDCDMLRPPVGLFSQVSVGGHHACAVNAYGGIECWGGGSYGEDVPPE